MSSTSLTIPSIVVPRLLNTTVTRLIIPFESSSRTTLSNISTKILASSTKTRLPVLLLVQRIQPTLFHCECLTWRGTLPLNGFSARFCDNCPKLVKGTRTLCVQCMDDVFLNTVDLCSSCSEATVLRPVGIKHTRAHLMIQTTRPIHDGEMAVLVPKSKGLAQTVKTVFNGSEPKTCCCCGDTVAPPCWVCLICGTLVDILS